MSRITRTRGSTSAGVDGPTGLKQNRLASVGEPGHERVNFRLQERLAAGDLDQIITQLERTSHDGVEIEELTLRERVRRVAVDTSQVARRQPYEHTGTPRECALALQAAIDLMDEQAAGWLFLEGLEPSLILVGQRNQWQLLNRPPGPSPVTIRFRDLAASNLKTWPPRRKPYLTESTHHTRQQPARP